MLMNRTEEREKNYNIKGFQDDLWGVVLYNPLSVQELVENIRSYIDELEYLGLIDNSDRSVDISSVLQCSEKIEYFSMQGNIGLAKALNFGCKKAAERGCDYMLLLDQNYCYRLGKMGKKMLRVGAAVMYQEFGTPVVRNIFGKKLVVFENSPMRYYYVARNEIYLRNKWGREYKNFRISFLKYFVVVMLQRQGIRKIIMMLKGMHDGLGMMNRGNAD